MPSYVIQNDDYLASGYVDSSYVGTADDLYVATGYIQDAIEGTATLASQASVTLLGGFLLSATSSVSSQATQTVTATITRTSTSTIASSASVQTSANVIRAGSNSSSAAFSVSSAGVQTKQGTATFGGAGGASVFAVATVSPSAVISASATLTSTAKRFVGGSAELITAGDEVTWDTALTWYEPRSDVWGPLFKVSAIKTVGSTLTYNFPVQSTLSADGDRTAVANITVDSFASLSANAVRVVDASATLNSAFTQSTQGQLGASVINKIISASASLSASGIYQVAGYPLPIQASTTLSADGDRIASGVATPISQATQATSGNRIRFGTTQLDVVTIVTANADRVADGIVLQASAGTLSAQAKQTKGPYQLELVGVFTQRCNGGRLRDGVATFSAFNSVLSALTIFNIDPFRVYTIPTESRIAVIEQDTRIFNVKSENRVNTIEAETRTNQVPSESRYLVVQPLKLVEEAGTLDRREG